MHLHVPLHHAMEPPACVTCAVARLAAGDAAEFEWEAPPGLDAVGVLNFRRSQVRPNKPAAY